MIKFVRIAAVLMLALAASLTFNAVSAQMMHFNLDITIETVDGADIPGGQVCVSDVTGGDTCQDIGGNPSGRDFYFPGLTDGDHSVTISGADPYLDIDDTVTLTEDDTAVSYTLQLEETPPTPATDVTPEPTSSGAASLPSTGTGTGTPASDNWLIVAGLLAMTLAAGSLVVARRQR